MNTLYQNSKIYNASFNTLELKPNLVEGNLDACLVVFINSLNEAFLNENDKAFLMKMLGAVKHDISNTLIINDKSEIKFKQLTAAGKATKMICFGSTRNTIGLNLQLKRYKNYSLQGIECLFVDAIENLKDDKKRKGALWTLMKQMFNIA
ncbi:MAG: hypothetical protein ACPGR5_05830 [Chitinophagales bacterium]